MAAEDTLPLLLLPLRLFVLRIPPREVARAEAGKTEAAVEGAEADNCSRVAVVGAPPSLWD